MTGTLKVEVLAEGVHSGDAIGHRALQSFRIMRQLMDRLEDARTGALLPEDFHCPIPEVRILRGARGPPPRSSAINVYKRLPWACGADGGAVLPMSEDPAQVLINGTWKPTLSDDRRGRHAGA